MTPLSATTHAPLDAEVQRIHEQSCGSFEALLVMTVLHKISVPSRKIARPPNPPEKPWLAFSGATKVKLCLNSRRLIRPISSWSRNPGRRRRVPE